MKLCYLVNQYPKVSHSFIRREILELERQGAEVLRIALRGWEQVVVDSDDVSEQVKTRYVLQVGVLRALAHVAARLLRQPRRFFEALSETFVLARGADKSLLKYLICFAEGCVAADWVQSAKATHIHAHFGTNSTDVALLTSLLTGVPYSFTVHGPDEFDHPGGLRLGRKIHHAAHVVAISSYGRSQLYRWAEAGDWNRISVVHCGLDLACFDAPETVPSGSTTFVCVGRLCEQKGQLLLLAALRRILDQGRDCRLVLAGDGEMRKQIEQYAVKLGVEKHLNITGWISSPQVGREIRAARALVLPSFAEGLPVVLMEALALGRPVISTYVAGIPELVTDGSCGWLVPAGDVEKLAEAMIECLGCTDQTLDAMGNAGRMRVQARHDIRTEAAKLLQLFQVNPV